MEKEQRLATVAEVRADVILIQEVMKSVMKADVHYGVVPGCGDKKTLLKPGAEKIMATFGLSAKPEIFELSTSDSIRYRIILTLMSKSGIDKGDGVGECSSDEEKYKWRKAVGKEYDETPEDRRRMKWRRGFKGGKDYQEQQIRTNPADLANTILKMAKKRALIDAVLTATAASDIFSQDLEDLPEEYIDQKAITSKPDVAEPQQKTTPKTEISNGDVKMSSEKQQKAIRTMASKVYGKNQDPLYQMMIEKYQVDSTEQLTMKQASETIDFLNAELKKNE